MRRLVWTTQALCREPSSHGRLASMGADYKAPGRHLSPLRPAVRCSQREDAVLSTIFDIFVLLFTVSCLWVLSHGVPRQQVQSFVHGIFAVVWWGFLRNKGVKGLCQDTLLATALFPLQWMPKRTHTHSFYITHTHTIPTAAQQRQQVQPWPSSGPGQAPTGGHPTMVHPPSQSLPHSR